MFAPLTEKSPLVLGSGSPRRKEILTSLRVPFEVVVGDADEAVRPAESPSAYLDRVVRAKLASIRAKLGAPGSDRAILVADTSVILDGDILGKPESDEHGFAMITRLAGRPHEVHTRFAIAGGGLSAEPAFAETVTTRVVFRPVSAGEARTYVASGEGRDKAGGYALQGLAAGFAQRIEGSYTNVVGLPACEVIVALRSLGLASAP